MRLLPSPVTRRFAVLGQGLDPSLALLAAIAFMTQVGVAVMLPLLPLYARTLGASPFVLGLLTSSFAITNAIGQLLAGTIAERIGPRRLVPAGMGIYAATNVLIATASSATLLIAWRSVSGLGAGLGLVAERLYLIGVVDRARLAFANGLLSAAGSAGTVAGPAVGGLVAAAADLRTPFLLVAVTSALAAGAALFLPRPRVGRREAGAGEMAQTPRAADGDAVEPAAPADVVAVAAADAVAAAASTAPPDDQRVDRGRLVILLIANIGLLGAFGSFITTYGPFATEVLGWSTAEIGLQFSLFGLGSILVGPWLAHEADRRGRRRIALVALLPVVAFAAALVAGLPSPVLAVGGVLAGGGIAGFEAAWYALLGEATGGARHGRAFGAVSALSNLGIVAGAMVAATLWSWFDVRAGLGAVLLALAAAGIAMLRLPADRPADESAPLAPAAA